MSFLKKIGRAATSGLKTITKPLTVPVTIAKDVRDKGIVKGLKAVPSRIHVDAIKAGVDFTADTVRAVAPSGSKVDRLAVKAIGGADKLSTWTQRRPVQTMIGAAAAGGAGYAAFVAAPAALAGGGGAAAGAGGGAAAGGAAGGSSALGAAAVAAGKAVAGTAVAIGAKYARAAVGSPDKPVTSDTTPATTGGPLVNPDGIGAATSGGTAQLGGFVARIVRLAFPGLA